MIMVGYVGYNTRVRAGLEFRFPPQVQKLVQPLTFESDHWSSQIQNVPCHQVDSYEHRYELTCVETKRPLVMILGDSHATALVPGMVQIARKNSFGLMVLSATQCPPVLNVDEYLFRRQCAQFTQQNIELIAKLKPEALIVTSAFREPRYFGMIRFLSSALKILCT